MYCPAVFREERPDVVRALIRAHPLATLVTQGTAGLSANLVPFSLVEREGGNDVIRAHLARGNDQIGQLREASEALVVFQGPQAYVTPAWYPTKREHGRVVPTWNYMMVQVRGRPIVVDDAAWLRSQVEALTEQQEEMRPDPWSVGDAPPSFVEGRLRAINGLEIPVERIVGKWKVSQNQPVGNRAGVAEGLREVDAGSTMADHVDASGSD